MEETREEIKQTARQARKDLSTIEKARKAEITNEDTEGVINKFIGGNLEVTPQQKMILSYARALSLQGKLMPDTYKRRFRELIPEGRTYLANLERLAQRVAELQGGGAAVTARRLSRFDVPQRVADMFGVARRPPAIQPQRREVTQAERQRRQQERQQRIQRLQQGGGGIGRRLEFGD